MKSSKTIDIGMVSRAEWEQRSRELIKHLEKELKVNVGFEISDLDEYCSISLLTYLRDEIEKARFSGKIISIKRPNEALKIMTRFQFGCSKEFLKELSIGFNLMENVHLERFDGVIELMNLGCNFPNLEILVISGSAITHIVQEKIKSADTFKSLNIDGTELEELDLSFLKGTPVETIQINANHQLEIIDLTPLIYCKSLKDKENSVRINDSKGTFQAGELAIFDVSKARERLKPLWDFLSHDCKLEINRVLRGYS